MSCKLSDFLFQTSFQWQALGIWFADWDSFQPGCRTNVAVKHDLMSCCCLMWRQGRCYGDYTHCNTHTYTHTYTVTAVCAEGAQSGMKWMASTDTETTLVDGKVVYVCVYVCVLACLYPWGSWRAKVLRQHFCQNSHLTYLTAVCQGVCVCVWLRRWIKQSRSSCCLIKDRFGKRKGTTGEGNKIRGQWGGKKAIMESGTGGISYNLI